MKLLHLFVFSVVSVCCYTQTDSVSSKDFKWRFEGGSNIGFGMNLTTDVNHWSSDLSKIPSFDSDYGNFSKVNWRNDGYGISFSINYLKPMRSRYGKNYSIFGLSIISFNGFNGNVFAGNERRFTIDSVTSQSSGQMFPVDSIVTSTWNEEFTSLPRFIGLSYGIDFNRINNFGFALKAEYMLLGSASVHSEKLQQMTYSVDGYGPEKTLVSSDDDYIMDMRSSLFRVSLPLYFGFPMNGKISDNVKPKRTSSYEEMKAQRLRAKSKKKKRYSVPRDPLMIISWHVTPIYYFGRINGASQYGFDFSFGMKVSMNF